METCSWIADQLAWLAQRKLRIRHRVTDENLARSFPDLTAAQRDDLMLRMWRHLVLLFCELVHAPRKIHKTNWRDFVETQGIERQVRYLLSDRPRVVVSGHFGNFEVGGQVIALLGYPTFTVAHTLDNRFVDQFIRRFREATGQKILPKKGSSYQLEQVLDGGGTLMILGDQSAGPKGCWIDFFGRPASCHKSFALFTLSQNAPMVIGYSRRIDDTPMRFEIGVSGIYDPEVDGMRDVDELSQWYSGLLEDVIRQDPEQYWWLHRRWKDPPARVMRRRQKKLAKAALAVDPAQSKSA